MKGPVITRLVVTLFSGTVLLCSFTSSQAQTLTLDFNSLPSSQGWMYESNSLAENDAFLADGSRLVQTTIGSGGNSFAWYSMPDIVDPNKPFTISFTARILSYEQISTGSSGLGFNFIAHDSEIQHRLGMTESSLQVDGQFVNLDTTVFHDYVFILNPGGGSEFFVDGALIATGSGSVFGSNNELIFGDSTGHENTNAEITAMSLTIGDTPPVCDIQMNQVTYIDGDTVTADVFRIANLTAASQAVEWKVWLGVPGVHPISIINLGADGSLVLPAGFDTNLGPLPFLPVSAALPRGNYEFSCRMLDPVTGELLIEDLNAFTIQ